MYHFSPSHFIPKLRPRTLHIRAPCIPGSTRHSRVANQSTSRPMSIWRSEEGQEPQARHGIRAMEGSEDAAPNPPEAQVKKRKPRNSAEFYRVQPVFDRRIHILGLGSIGMFVAHSLRDTVNPPPVTLLFHKWSHLKEWREGAQQLKVLTNGIEEKQEGFDAELALPRPRSHGKEIAHGYDQDDSNAEKPLAEGESIEPISSLIICTKATAVVSALSSIKHRLHKDSVIMFMQNGMGIVEEVNENLFPDPDTRPYYMLGINSHGVHRSLDNRFTVTHAGFGSISFGLLPHERERSSAPYLPTRKVAPHGAEWEPKHIATPDSDTPEPTSASVRWTPHHRYLIRTLLGAPVLCATGFSPPDLLQLQLEKLAANCIVNPLTVLLDSRNGSILYNYHITRTMRLLLSEISLVIRSLPELQYIPNVQQRFDPGRLESAVVSVAQRTKDNISSMLADTRAGRPTEIDYINGWIVKKGEEQGVRCLTNYMVANLVKGKNAMIQYEMREDVPLVEGAPTDESGVMLKDAIAGTVHAAQQVSSNNGLGHAEK